MKLKHKVLVVFGTRPEAIKMAPVITALNSFSDRLRVEVCVTAQHRKMLDQVLEIFKIRPNYDLDLMHPNQSLSDLTSRVLVGIQEILKKSKPDLVLVHGDTTTTFATSLACFYESIPIGHVEAGLRTYDTMQPFPEELNRQVVSKIAKIHFAPTELAKSNLVKEGIAERSIHVTGNTVVDSLKIADQQIEIQQEIKNQILENLNGLLNFDIYENKYVLITGHRRENFGQGFEHICNAIYRLADKFEEVKFVYPVHLNPKVIEPVTALLGGKTNVKLIKPQDYLSFISLLKNCHLVLTDSGGVQEEAPSFGKPVLIMRNKTERPEAVDAGTSILVGTDLEKISKTVTELLEDFELHKSIAETPNPFGDGKSAQRIAEKIFKFLNS